MDAPTISILFLGDEKVGKSTFLSRVARRGPTGLSGKAEVPLLKDMDQPYVFEVSLRRDQYRLELSDTSSPENWKLLRPDLIVLCYDISQRLSLINLQRLWIKEVRTTFTSSDVLPILVVGLKRDLRSEDDPNGIIYPHEGYRVAQEIRADKYMECSAVTGELMVETVEDIMKTAAKTTTIEGGQSEGACALM